MYLSNSVNKELEALLKFFDKNSGTYTGYSQIVQALIDKYQGKDFSTVASAEDKKFVETWTAEIAKINKDWYSVGNIDVKKKHVHYGAVAVALLTVTAVVVSKKRKKGKRRK
jgi:hypothetical protein